MAGCGAAFAGVAIGFGFGIDVAVVFVFKVFVFKVFVFKAFVFVTGRVARPPFNVVFEQLVIDTCVGGDNQTSLLGLEDLPDGYVKSS